MNYPHKTSGELRPFWQIGLLLCGIIGPVFFLIVYFSFGSISPDFDMLRQPIGRLELINYGWIQSANFILLGLFTCAFAFGLYKERKAGFGKILLPVSNLLTALGMILMGIFITKPAHTYVSVFTFVMLVASFFLFARRFLSESEWKHWALYTNICAVVILILIAASWYAIHINSQYAGVFEHVVIIIRTVWITAFIIKLLWGHELEPVRRST